MGKEQGNTLEVQIIGVIHSCFKEKFGIPRQPGMVSSATAELEFLQPFDREEVSRGLEQFSHVWIHFLFHDCVVDGWKNTVRPPWLGGSKRVGVLATRSPHRPNHLGLSVVRLEAVVREKGKTRLLLSGVDILDGSPVIDVKPYIPYSDIVEGAKCGYAEGKVPDVVVEFSLEADEFCTNYTANGGRPIRRLIEEMIRQDPRPAKQKSGTKTGFGMLLWDVNVRFAVVDGGFLVESCTEVGQKVGEI